MATDVHTSTIPRDLKDRILSDFWGIAKNEAGYSRLAERYSEYYSTQVHLMLYDGGQNMPAWTHNDVVDVMTRIRDSQSRQEISSYLQSVLDANGTAARGDIVNRLIDLGARLGLMTSFGKASFAAERQISLDWTEGAVTDALRQHFTQQTATDGGPELKLPKIFTARNIHRIGGLKIEWTPYLSEHLRLLDLDERVAIFPHVEFLKLHRKSDLFPPGFIDETIRTLALLFPLRDTATKRWIQSLPNISASIVKCGHLGTDARKIGNFVFWRDRLVALKEVFDEAEPRSLSQLWFDRRRRMQWYTFWVAILVFVLAMFFGLVQSVEGALQVYVGLRGH